MRLALLVALTCAPVACARSGRGDGGGDHQVIVAAAADLSAAFKEVGETYAATGHKKPTFTFGSTGLLGKQIAEGAPFDVFAAANVSFADEAVKTGRCDAATKVLYARGRIVVWTKQGDRVAAPTAVADLADARFVKIAIANPDHAPYGRAAQQALMAAGVWDKVKARVVYGENVQQTLQYAQTGNADAAIVALSLATVTDGRWLSVPPEMHEPIDQALVVCGTGPRADAARAFVAYLGSPEGRGIMRRYGFLLPGETLLAK